MQSLGLNPKLQTPNAEPYTLHPQPISGELQDSGIPYSVALRSEDRRVPTITIPYGNMFNLNFLLQSAG